MSGAVARLQSFMGSFFSNLAAKRGQLILVLLVQGACAAGYLFLEHRWIEAGVVQSLKNVSSMHQRSFNLLQTTLNYQLESIGEVVRAIGDSWSAPPLHALLAKEVQSEWLDAVIVLDADGKIVASEASVGQWLNSVLPPSVLSTHSFKDSPHYRAALAGEDESPFFVPLSQVSEPGRGVMAMYRVIKSADGQLLGIVVGFTSLRSLSDLLNTDIERGLNLGRRGVLGFVDQQTHQWVYRYAFADDIAAGHIIQGPVINPSSFEDTQYGPDIKFYRSTLDGLERLTVLAPEYEGQWLQVVAASKDEYLASWRVLVAVSVLVFAGMCFLQWLLLGFFRANQQQRKVLDLVLDNVDAYVYFKSSDRRFLYVNAKTATLFGLPAEQIAGRLDRELMPPDLADAYWVMDQKVFASGKKQSGQEVLNLSEGETRYYASIKVPVHLPDQPPALIGFSTDVTELHEQTVAREAAEKALAVHNHYLWLNNQVLEQLGQNTSLPEVLSTMLRIIDDYHAGTLGVVSLVADNGTELLSCAAPNFPAAWLSVTARTPIMDMSGSAATAVYRGETVVIEDIASHPYWAAPEFAAIRDAALGLGLRAAWAQPIKSSEGKVLGVFNLYQREPAAPDAEDLALLADYAKLAQMVIERARLAEALQESQTLYRLITENSSDVIWVMRYPDLTYSYISPSIAWLYGWTPEEFQGRPPDELMSADVLRQWHGTLEEHVRRIGEGDLTGCFIECEREVQDKDGNAIHVEVVANIMLDNTSRPTHIVGSSRNITRRKAAEDTIRKMAFFDQLTGLPNRRMMEDRLAQMLALAQREQRKMSLLFVDLDRFKAVNDQHGHAAGDWLLKQVAERMNTVLRNSDTASRIGGDEFVILLPDARAADDAVLVAEKIRCVLEQPFVMDDGVELDISSSIGVVMYPDQAGNMRDLLHFGDEAMYRAKKGGRNAVEVFNA